MINFMTAKKADFKQLPHISQLEECKRVFDSLIIVPERYKHDSGYMCMSVVGCVGENAVCIMGGGSDVLNLDGIGGYGKWFNGFFNGELPDKIEPKGWSIDCLPCGCLRLFSSKGGLTIGSMLSSFEIYAEGRCGK